MKKKTLSLVLGAVLAMSMMVTGCGSSSSDSGSAEDSASTEEASTDESADASADLSGTVATDGSTSMEKVMGYLGESFQNDNPGVTVTYNPTGSGSGIQAVSEGSCDIGLASRDLTDDEKASGLTETVVAIDGIAIIVNLDNPVADLSMDQIADIYTGKITNWKDAGGDDNALDIAEMSGYVANSSLREDIPLREMAEKAEEMVSRSVDAFVKNDVSIADTVIKSDDKVDSYLDEIKSILIDDIQKGKTDGALDLFLTAKYYERIGDHAENIAHWVIYRATGVREGLPV